jgi:subtilase-type serine protease
MRKKGKLLSTLICLELLTTTMSAQVLAVSADSFRTQEYKRMGSLDFILAADAYAKGYSGKGITLGILDMRLRLDHIDFAGKTIYTNYTDDGTIDWNVEDHGCHVAGIMVANKDNIQTHGVAFNADLLSTAYFLNPYDSYNFLAQYPQVKVTNASAGGEIYLEDQDLSAYHKTNVFQKIYYVDIDGKLQYLDFAAAYFADDWQHYISALGKQDKLVVWATGNAGRLSSGVNDFADFRNTIDKYNYLKVIACSPYQRTVRGTATFNGPTPFSDMAMFEEDLALTAPGYFIKSTKAISPHGDDIMYGNGTSMAAPHVTAVAGLVQEAYPYLSAKQLADVVLSTTSSYKIDTTRPFNNQLVDPTDTIYGMNIIYYDNHAKPTTQAEWKEVFKAAEDITDENFEKIAKEDSVYDEATGGLLIDKIHFYNNMPITVAFGQGVVNADKATNGLGTLNAKRLTSSALDTKYAAGSNGKQALYAVNTAGYNSAFSNDITETRVLLPGTGTDRDEELAKRQSFYRQYAQEAMSHGDPLLANKANEVEAYIATYNSELVANPLLGLHVGLYKAGEGILRLTGNNTYQGSTVAAGGTLAVDGSVAGDAYSTSSGILAGTGTVQGNVYNNGTLQPGTYAVNTVYDTNPAYSLGTLKINGKLNSTGTLQIAVQGTDNSKLNVQGVSTITGSTLSLKGSTTQPVVNHNYNYLTSQGGIIGNVTPETISPYLTLQATVDGNNGYFMAANTTKLGNQPGTTPSENSVGAALNNRALSAIDADPTSQNAQTMNALFYQDSTTAGKFIKDVTSEARAELLSQSPMSALTNETVYSRLDTVDFSGDLGMPMQVASLDAGAPQVKTSLPVTLDATNNMWFKLFRGFENYNYHDSLKNKTFGGTVGYDHALSLNTRMGGLFSYGVTDYSTDNIQGKSYDWRLGVYGDHKNGDWDYQALVTYGSNHYDLDRDVSWEGTKTNSDYKAKVWDGEVKARYFIPSTKNKTWQVKPYGKLSYTHTSQDAYAETGSSIFKQNLNSASNNSWRGEVGVEFKRNFRNQTGWGGSLGYKRVISGLNPELNGTFVGDTNGFSIKSDNDRNYVTYSLNARGSLGGKWMGQAEFRGEASHNTHKEILSVTAKYSF